MQQPLQLFVRKQSGEWRENLFLINELWLEKRWWLMDEIWLTRLEFLFFHSESPFGHISELDWTLRCCSTAFGWGFFLWMKFQFNAFSCSQLASVCCAAADQTSNKMPNTHISHLISLSFGSTGHQTLTVRAAMHHKNVHFMFAFNFKLPRTRQKSSSRRWKRN